MTEPEYTYTDVASLQDIPPGRTLAVKVNGENIVLANVEGHVCALQRRCPHFGGDLAKGKLNGKLLTCPWHAASFDVTTGQVSDPAHLLFLKFKTKNAKTYPTHVEEDRVFVGS